MDVFTQSTFDKSSWPPGPWQAEADLVSFTEPRTRYPVLCNRDTATGNWLAYVGVPADHIAYGALASAIPIAAYGGIVYAGALANGDTSHWYIGFSLGPPAAARPATGVIGLYVTQAAATAQATQLAVDLSRLNALADAGILTVELPLPATPTPPVAVPPMATPAAVTVSTPATPPIAVPASPATSAVPAVTVKL